MLCISMDSPGLRNYCQPPPYANIIVDLGKIKGFAVIQKYLQQIYIEIFVNIATMIHGH